ncbi:MAG: chemotaxis protein CheA [Actinomycetia bacterium]|nr:chemotaxis protein CheA [Actinomycetes bacterium]
MDLTEYLPMFLAESREHLQELNLAVVRVEEVPDDSETVGDIFRIAHSLKGMSATMGFERIAALTHAMEDVFELLRQRRGGLELEAVNVLLECLDALSDAFEAIDTEGVERLDEAPLVVRLKALIRDHASSDAAEDAVPVLDVLQARADGRQVLHCVVTLDDAVLMPAVRAYMAIAALSDHGEILASVPTEDGVEQFSGRTIEVWIASDHESDVLSACAAAVPDVAGVTVTDATGAPDAEDACTPDVEDASVAFVEPDAAAAADAPAQRKTAATSTVRVDAERLDQLMHLMGELVIHRTHAESLALHAAVPGLHQAMQDLTRSSQALQTMVMQIRMIPVEAVFLRFPRLVRDLSAKLGKKVDLQLSGSDTELDRTVVDALGDPLVHLVRNSLDHGLESAEDREAAGKPATGTLEISARHAGGSVLISVRDDGRGIDPAHVARKAAERGLISEDAIPGVDMQRAVELLFTAGFSTAEVMSDVSGRGVGMDAVRTTIRELGGEVLMQSEPGKGTTAQIRLPLTLAIMSALLVESCGLPFAVQLDRVERTLRLQDYPVRSVAGKRMLVLRDGVLPILDLAESLGHGKAADATHAVVVRGADHRLALAVEHLVGQRELVTRPLPPEVSGGSALSGGAVLSNGQIALIVDCDAVTQAANENAAPALAAA